MARDFTPRSRTWRQWASSLLLVAAGCVQALATAIAAPQTPATQARIWFYRGDEPMTGYSGTAIPTVAANGTYVGQAESGTFFYRDASPGRYHVTVQAAGANESAGLELSAGQQAAVIVPNQVAEAEVPSLAAEGGQR